MTGEHAVVYTIKNHGSATCTVASYPRIALYGKHGALMAFRYANGGGQYVTHSKPRTVVLAPGASAYVLVAKYRCDVGSLDTAATIEISLATSGGAEFSQREAARGPDLPDLSYCSGGPSDPGQIVYVSPVESTQLATVMP